MTGNERIRTNRKNIERRRENQLGFQIPCSFANFRRKFLPTQWRTGASSFSSRLRTSFIVQSTKPSTLKKSSTCNVPPKDPPSWKIHRRYASLTSSVWSNFSKTDDGKTQITSRRARCALIMRRKGRGPKGEGERRWRRVGCALWVRATKRGNDGSRAATSGDDKAASRRTEPEPEGMKYERRARGCWRVSTDARLQLVSSRVSGAGCCDGQAATAERKGEPNRKVISGDMKARARGEGGLSSWSETRRAWILKEKRGRGNIMWVTDGEDGEDEESWNLSFWGFQPREDFRNCAANRIISLVCDK